MLCIQTATRLLGFGVKVDERFSMMGFIVEMDNLRKKRTKIEKVCMDKE